MSGINFLSENYMDSASLSITTGAANAQFPLSNLQIDTTAKKFRSTGNTVVIVADLGQLRDIDTVALVGDTTDTFQVTALSVKTSATNDFTLSTPIAISLSSEFGIGYEFITSVNHRYVEFTFTGNGSFAEVSNIFIGERVNLAFNSLSIDSFRYRHDDLSQIKRSDFGQKFINEFPFQKKIVGTIKFCTKAEQDELDTIFLRHGRHDPLWMIVDPNSDAMTDGQFKLAIYGYLEKMPSWNAVGGQLYNAGIEMKQVV